MWRVLEEALPGGLVERLRRLEKRKGIPLFEYDAHAERFEPAVTELSEKDLDALLLACDALNDRRGEVGAGAVPEVEHEGRSKVTLQFVFEPEEAGVFERFQRLIEKHIAPADDFFVEESPSLSGLGLQITVAYSNDHDYRQKRDYVQWLLELAKRTHDGTPYQGSRA